MFSIRTLSVFLLVTVLVVEAAKKPTKRSGKSKRKTSASKRKVSTPAAPKNLQFTVPLFDAARGPHQSAADYLDRVYPGIRFAEKSKNDYLNNFYAANISLGTKFQSVSVRVLTSGSGLWTYEKGCYTRFVSGFQPKRYYMKQSKTKRLNERTELHDRITDVFKIGRYVNRRQPFVAATSQLPSKPKGFKEPIEPARLLNVHGVLALGNSETTNGITPVWSSMANSLKAPIYTVWLKRQIVECKNNLAGYISFGGFENGLCNTTLGPFKYFNMEPKGTKWTVKLEKFLFNNGNDITKNLVDPSKNVASVELGASHIYAPREVVEDVVKTANASLEAGTFVVKCSDFGWLYDFIFYIEGQELKVPARHFVSDIGLENGNCALLIDESTRLQTPWVLGDVFFRTFCTQFNQKEKRLGLMRSIDSVCKP
ncbi:Aspartic protease 1 [Aphelenchoides besseyi]|nr:Aspartic protease 1 [Aphelenchoides besseyi]